MQRSTAAGDIGDPQLAGPPAVVFIRGLAGDDVDPLRQASPDEPAHPGVDVIFHVIARADHQAGGLPRPRQGRLSHQPDPEDLMAVVDGRQSLLEECRLSPPPLRNDLVALPALLPGDQASQQRLQELLQTLRGMAALAEP